jgi:hypothetical protein
LEIDLSAHGLRKLGATRAADNGATEYELMAIFGWSSSKLAGLYTRKANRMRLEAGAAPLLMRAVTVQPTGNEIGPPSAVPASSGPIKAKGV